MTEPAKPANEPSAQDINILKRLRRIEGQVRGLQRMIAEGRDCPEVLIQLSGARSALNAVGELVLEQYAGNCHVKARRPVTPVDVVHAVKLLRG